MAPQVEISVPATTISKAQKPYTLYSISLRLPLRSYTIQKRYSDFVALHSSLTDQVGAAPPSQLPSKSWFSRTVSNPELTEERRKGLELYLQTINDTDDTRWRNTSIWRTFLNLPSQTGKSIASSSTPLDPTIWLDHHRELKQQLHDARLNLTIRDQATTPQKQHEAGVTAKSCLIKAGSIINGLEEGLTSQNLGAGEIRRRKDLVAAAKRDKEGLENLLNAMNTKSKLDTAVATIQDKQNLVGTKPKSGRVLGKETAETRELDNQGVLQLQKQKMADQDLDVDDLRKIVQRQKEMGIAINEELELQKEMLRMVEEDTDRVQGKINITKKRIDKIK